MDWLVKSEGSIEPDGCMVDPCGNFCGIQGCSEDGCNDHVCGVYVY